MSSGNDKLERELELFLADDSRVAALYRRLPKDEPDARLDAAILAQARAAVAPRRARPRWLPAMSAAAAVVIAAGLAYRVGPQVWNERSAVSEKSEQSVAAPAPAAQTPKDAAPVNEPMQQAETSVAPPLRTEAVSSNAMAKQQVELERAQVGKLQDKRRATEEQKPAPAAVAKRAAQPAPPSDSAYARDSMDATSAPAGASAVQPQAMKSLASPPRLDAVPAPTAESAAAPVAAAPPKPMSAPAPSAFPTAAGAAYAPAAPPAAATAPAPARERAAQSAVDIEVNLYPEHWIADIHQMLKDGRRDDAIRNLIEFRKRYPDYKLPDDLRDLK
jgi:Meckel syndrome type 1 protein